MAVRQVKGRATWGKAYKGFSVALAEAGKHLTKQGETIMTNACEEWLQDVDYQWPRGARSTVMNLNTGRAQRAYGAYASGYRGGTRYFPWYTGNLHDSFATVVTDGNRVISIRQMTPGATVGQFDDRYGYIDGAYWGQVVAERATHVLLPGIQAKLTIGVPYAEKVNTSEAHKGFIEEFQKDFVSEMIGRVEYEFGHTRNLIIK